MSEQANAALKEQAKQRVTAQQPRLEELNRWLYDHPRDGLPGVPAPPDDSPKPWRDTDSPWNTPPTAWKPPSRPEPATKAPS